MQPIFFVEISGGLGNQLFQLVAANALASVHNTQIVVLKSETSWSILFPRSVYWESLFAKLPTIEKTPAIRYVHHDIDPIRGFEPIVFPRIHSNKNKENQEKKDDKKESCYYVQLKGGYQHRNHFWAHRQTFIHNCLPDESVIQSWKLFLFFANKYNIRDNQYLAFLHIRRGDYKKIQHCHVVLPLTYYINAMQYFDSKVKFLLFCEQEDLDAVKRDFLSSEVFRHRLIVDKDMISEVPDYQQMYLMSRCLRGGMIANSTFSVWAAYLHATKTGVFTYPDTFFSHEPKLLPNIFDPTWCKVATHFVQQKQNKAA